MHLKDIIANIDLCNGQLDIAGNQIAYPARAALVNSAKALVKAGENATYEQHARFASLCAVNIGIGCVFDLRNMRDTVRFVLRADAPSEPVDYAAIVSRDHENGRIFIRDKAHMNELIALRREQDIAKRLEAEGEVEDVVGMIENGESLVTSGEYTFMNQGCAETLGYDEALIEGETDAISEKIARACIDAKDRVQRDLDRCFVPERYQRLNEALLGITQLLAHLGITDDSLRQMKAKRREHLAAIFATPEEKAPKKMKVVKAAA